MVLNPPNIRMEIILSLETISNEDSSMEKMLPRLIDVIDKNTNESETNNALRIKRSEKTTCFRKDRSFRFI